MHGHWVFSGMIEDQLVASFGLVIECRFMLVQLGLCAPQLPDCLAVDLPSFIEGN